MTHAFASPLHEYQYRIESGDIVAGKWILAIYKILVDGIASGKYLLDLKTAKTAVQFIENFCHHCEGRNDLIKLELWQQAAVYAIFGVKDPATGMRQFREIILIVARKNGKSTFCAALQAYVAFMDGEIGANIFDIAPKLDQAKLVFVTFSRMVEAEPELADLAEVMKKEVVIDSTNTTVKPIPFSSGRTDGLNPHMVVADEVGSWPAFQGLRQMEVLKSAFGAREEPILLETSTAGYINDGPYDDAILRSTSFLLGNSGETRLLPLLYIIDDPDKWDDLTELRKSNPNMGVSVKESFFAEEIAIARSSPSKKIEFLVKYCNIKQAQGAAVWLPYQVVDASCREEYVLEMFRGCYCVLGLDLSQTRDLTACAVLIEKDGIIYTIAHFWTPAATIEEHCERENVPYRVYEQNGWLSLSGENFVDYHDVFDWIRMLIEDYEIIPLKLGYDRYSAQFLIQMLEDYGVSCDDVWQGWNLHPVIMEADGLIRDGTLRLGKNNLLKAHFLNSALKQNNDNRKYQLVKTEPRVHIDGAVAVLDALTVRQKWYPEIGEQLKNAG